MTTDHWGQINDMPFEYDGGTSLPGRCGLSYNPERPRAPSQIPHHLLGLIVRYVKYVRIPVHHPGMQSHLGVSAAHFQGHQVFAPPVISSQRYDSTTSGGEHLVALTMDGGYTQMRSHTGVMYRYPHVLYEGGCKSEMMRYV